MIFLVLCPISYGLGWFSHYTVMIDRGLIGLLLLIFGFRPLFSTGFSSIEGAPDFHNRDFIGPWTWLFSELSIFTQGAIVLVFILYFLGKISSWIYLVGGFGEKSKR